MANVNIVSVTSIYGGNYGWALSNTLTTTLLAVDAEKLLKINRIVCTNVDGSAAADLNLYVDGMGTAAANGLTPTGASATTYLAKTISVPADASLVVTDTPIYLLAGDILKGGASATGDLELFITYEVLDDA
jgi:hypothetical protein|tara:strand:+ start:332 stop:727 length:396 start_codon:yes stop_codon:yes gene_type:complete